MKMFWRRGAYEDCNETYLKYEEDENVQQIPHLDCSEPGRYQPAGGVCPMGPKTLLPVCPAARHQGAHTAVSGRFSLSSEGTIRMKCRLV